MLNKKSLFNFVYAIALVGAVMSCFGILNEFLNVAQLYGITVSDMNSFKEENYFEPFFFYLLAFLVSALAVTTLLLHLFGVTRVFGKINLNKKNVVIVLALSCAVLLIMSFVFIFFLRYYYEYTSPYGNGSVQHYKLAYYDYLVYYTFRSGVMSFVANAGILLGCHLLDAKRKNATEGEQASE
jgi:hypothetical protein